MGFLDLLNMKKYIDRAAFNLFADSFNIWDLNGGKESTLARLHVLVMNFKSTGENRLHTCLGPFSALC
jgi:hypothetical protein